MNDHETGTGRVSEGLLRGVLLLGPWRVGVCASVRVASFLFGRGLRSAASRRWPTGLSVSSVSYVFEGQGARNRGEAPLKGRAAGRGAGHGVCAALARSAYLM